MTEESNIKFTIALSDPDLDEEELDEAGRNVLREMNELDTVESASLVKRTKAPAGSKAISGFGLGIVEAMQRILQHPEIGGFDRVKVLLNSYPPSSHLDLLLVQI